MSFITAPFNNMGTLKFQTQLSLGFTPLSIIIMATNIRPLKTEINKMDRNPPINNPQTWPLTILCKALIISGDKHCNI